MKLAIMQPYFFPYIGYFQLIHATDTFVFYDDVSYIRQGWVNRNRILVNGKPGFMTVPISGASSSSTIADTKIHPRNYDIWRSKLLKTLHLNYQRAPGRDLVLGIVEQVLSSPAASMGDLAKRSVQCISEVLSIARNVVVTSSKYENQHLSGAARVLDICEQEGADLYVNLPGGRSLYSQDQFSSHKLQLRFLDPILTPYDQQRTSFHPGLSILDVLMFNSIHQTQELLLHYRLHGDAAPLDAAPILQRPEASHGDK